MTKSKTKPVRRMWAAGDRVLDNEADAKEEALLERIFHQGDPKTIAYPVYVVDARPEAMEQLAKKILTKADNFAGEKYGVRGNYFNIEFTRAVLASIFKSRSKGAK